MDRIYCSIEKINVLNCSKIKNMAHLMIERNPEIMFGKPVIKGTRITVEFLMRKLADGFNSANPAPKPTYPASYP